MSKVYLKIKICSLAAEARIIRREEKKHSGDLRSSLHLHRVHQVRQETRAALLAYAFLRKRSFLQAEYHPWPRLGSMAEAGSHRAIRFRATELVRKYGELSKESAESEFKSWLEAGANLTMPAQTVTLAPSQGRSELRCPM